MRHMNGGGTPFGKFIPAKKEEETPVATSGVDAKPKQKGYSVIQPAAQEEDVKAAVAKQVQQALHEEKPAPAVAPAPAPAPVVASKSIIASDMVITGNIETKGNIEILGTHNGGVKAEGVVMVAGTVNGNIEAKALILQDCTVTAEQLIVGGKVAVVGTAKASGDITCESIDIDASVVGNIRVAKKCTINSTAVIDGDITAGSISIEEGAKVNSRIEITG